MSRQYFRDLPIEPLPVANSAVILTSAADTLIFAQVSQITIPAGDIRPGKCWKMTAGGVLTTGASGTWTITPRFGQIIGSPSMGASAAITSTVSGTAIPWMLEFWCICRTLGLTGANSTFTGVGKFAAQSSTTVGAAWQILFGNTVASVDAFGISAGIQMSINASIAGAITPNFGPPPPPPPPRVRSRTPSPSP
jgi:hypothetical protein